MNLEGKKVNKYKETKNFKQKERRRNPQKKKKPKESRDTGKVQ